MELQVSMNVEDQADVERREQEMVKARLEHEMKLKPQAVQRNLPRPTDVNHNILRPADMAQPCEQISHDEFGQKWVQSGTKA